MSEDADLFIDHNIFIKKNRKIVISFTKKIGLFKNLNIDALLQFKLWHNHPKVKNIYLEADSLEAVDIKLQKLFCKNNTVLKGRILSSQIEEPTKVVFNFSKVIGFQQDQDRISREGFSSIFYHASKVEFIDCSTLLIEKFFEDQSSNETFPPTISFKKCRIDDKIFKNKVLQSLPKYQNAVENQNKKSHASNNEESSDNQVSHQFENTSFEFRSCPNITDATLKQFGLWKVKEFFVLNPSLRDNINLHKDTGCSLKICSSPISSSELIHLSYKPFYLTLKSLKLKKLNQCKGYDVLKEMLSHKQEMQSDTLIPINSLKNLSFDSTVCNKFDDLPIGINFKNLVEIKYESNSKDKDPVLLSRIFKFSFTALKTLKLKSCHLSNQFFSNLSNLFFTKTLVHINFKNSTLDLEGFKSFLASAQLQYLISLNLSGTNIDDGICSLIATQTSFGKSSQNYPFMSLKFIDVSAINSPPQETNFEITQINLRGCKNITSGFFLTLQAENILKNIEHLDVSGTSICNNFIDLLMRDKEELQNQLKQPAVPIVDPSNFQIESSKKKKESAAIIEMTPFPQRKGPSQLSGSQNLKALITPQKKTAVQMRQNMMQQFQQRRQEHLNDCIIFIENEFNRQIIFKQLEEEQEEKKIDRIEIRSNTIEKKQEKTKEVEKDIGKKTFLAIQKKQKPQVINSESEEDDDEDEEEEDGEVEEGIQQNEKSHHQEMLDVNDQSQLSHEELNLEDLQSNQNNLESLFDPALEIIPSYTTSNWNQNKPNEQQKDEEVDKQEEQKEDNSNHNEKNNSNSIINQSYQNSEAEEKGSQLNENEEENEQEDEEEDEGEEEGEDEENSEKSRINKSQQSNKQEISSSSEQQNQRRDQDRKSLNSSSSSTKARMLLGELDLENEHESQNEKANKKHDKNEKYDDYYSNALISMVALIPKKALKKSGSWISNFGNKLARSIDRKLSRALNKLRQNSKPTGSSTLPPQEECEKEVIALESSKSESIYKLQFLNLSNCTLITPEKLLEFLQQNQCKVNQTLCNLDISGTNLINPENCKFSYSSDAQKQESKTKGLLQQIIENIPNLVKLNISNTLISKDQFSRDPTFSLQDKHLIKLKANYTNFDFRFIKNDTGNLHQVQLKGCTHVTKVALRNFIESISKSENSTFDLWKLLTYFKSLMTDEFLLQVLTENINAFNHSIIDLSGCGLLELNYNSSEMKKIFKQLTNKNSITETINLSNTRVGVKFVRSILQEAQKLKPQRISQLILEDCPMIDGSIFQQSTSNYSNKETSHLLYQKSFEAHLMIKYVRHCLKDEDLAGIEKQSKKILNYSTKNFSFENNQNISHFGFINLFSSKIMKSVESLNLSFTLINDRAMRSLKELAKTKEKSNFSQLKSLSLKGCYELTKVSLIDLCEANGFHDDFNLECAFELPHLIDLEIIKTISNSVYFSNVQHLSLSKYPKNDIDEVISQLCLKGRDAPLSMKSINLTQTMVSDSGLQFISVSKNLKFLSRIYLHKCSNIFDKGFSYLLESTNLISLDVQHLLLQAGQVAKMRVFDTLSSSALKDQIKELHFFETKLSISEIEGIFETLKQLKQLTLVTFQSASNIDEQGVKRIIESSLQLKLSYLILPSAIKKVSQPQSCITFKEDTPERKQETLEKLKLAICKQYCFHFEDNLTEIASIVNIPRISLDQVIPPQGYFSKHQSGEQEKQMNLNLNSFFDLNPQVISNLFLDSLLIFKSSGPSDPQLQLTQLDLSRINGLTDKCLIRFFYYTTFALKYVNISNTHASENSILALLANEGLNTNLQTIIFDNCSYMNYSKSLLGILVKRNPLPTQKSSLQKTRILFRYKKYFDETILSLYLKILNSQLHFFSRYSVPWKKFLSFQVSPLFKINIPKILDLEGSNITLKDSTLQLFALKNFTIINLSNTQIDIQGLKHFCSCQSKAIFKQELKYIWMDNTTGISDQDFSDSSFFENLGLTNLNYNEFLYSKGSVLKNSLISFSKYSKQNSYLKLSHSIQFEYFPFISFEVAKTLIDSQISKDEKYQKNSSKISFLSFSFNQQNGQCYNQIMESPEFRCQNLMVNGIFIKNSTSGCLLKETLQPEVNKEFKAKETNLANDLFQENEGEEIAEIEEELEENEKNVEKEIENDKSEEIQFQKIRSYFCLGKINPFIHQLFEKSIFSRFINIMFLTTLDLRGAILSGNQLIELFNEINENNCIQVIDISNHTTVTDLTLQAMMIRKIKKTKSLPQETPKEIDIEKEVSTPFSQDQNMNQIMALNSKHRKAEKIHEMTQYVPSNKGLIQRFKKRVGGFFQGSKDVPDDVVESVLDKFSEEGRQSYDEIDEQLQLEASKEEFTKVKVFPYLQKLKIRGTSVTENSFISILKQKPFNTLFQAEDLLDQYCESCTISDETILALAHSTYLRNIEVLNIEEGHYSCDSISELIGSEHCIHIQEIRLNCSNLNESTFISLAQTKNFPNLKILKPTNIQNCFYSLGYLARAKYFNMSFDLESSTLLKEKTVYQSNKFINNLIVSNYMLNIRELVLDNMNEHMTALKEFFQLAKYCYNLEIIRLRNIIDKVKYYYTWKELADSSCFPNLRQIQIEYIRFTENLNVLLQQKNKPLLDLNDIIQSEGLIQESTLIALSKQHILLNSSHISLQKLRHIGKSAWDTLASSPYCFHIKSIDLSFDSLSSESQEEEQKDLQTFSNTKQINTNQLEDIGEGVRKGFLKPLNKRESKQNPLVEQSCKLEILLGKGFGNLEQIIIQNCDQFSEKELEVIYQAEVSGHLSPKFDILGILNQLAEQFRLTSEKQTPEQKMKWENISKKLSPDFIDRLLRKYKTLTIKNLDLSFFSVLLNPYSQNSALSNIQLEFVKKIELQMLTILKANSSKDIFWDRCKYLKSLHFVSSNPHGTNDIDPSKYAALSKQCLEAIKNIQSGSISGEFDYLSLMKSITDLLSKNMNLDMFKEIIKAQEGRSAIQLFINNTLAQLDEQTLYSSTASIIGMASSLEIICINIGKEKENLDKFFKSLCIYRDNLTSNQLNSLSILSREYKMSPSIFSQMCEANIFSKNFPLFEFIAKYIDESFTLKQFIQVTNTPCYFKATQVILSIQGLKDEDDSDLENQENPKERKKKKAQTKKIEIKKKKKEEEEIYDIVKLLKLEQLQNLSRITFQSFEDSNQSLQEKVMIKFFNSNFIIQKPEIILEFGFQINQVLFSLLKDESDIQNKEENKRNIGLSQEESLLEHLESRRSSLQGSSNSNSATRYWQREVAILLAESLQLEIYPHAVFAIINHPEARNHLQQLEINSSLVKKIEDTSFVSGIFSDNSIEHLHFSHEFFHVNQYHFQDLFFYMKKVISISFDPNVFHFSSERLSAEKRIGDKKKGGGKKFPSSFPKKDLNTTSHSDITKKLIFQFILNTKNVDILEQVLSNFSYDLNRTFLDQLLKNQLSKHLSHISFCLNKNFEISTVKEKLLRSKTVKESSNHKQSQSLQSKSSELSYQRQLSSVNPIPNFMKTRGYNGDEKSESTQKEKIEEIDSSHLKIPSLIDYSSKSLISSAIAMKRVFNSSIQNGRQQIQTPQQVTRSGGDYDHDPNNNSLNSSQLGDKDQGNYEDNEEDDENHSDLKKYEKFQKEEIEDLIDENYLLSFLSKLDSACEIDFSYSSIKHEHVESLKSLSTQENLIYLNFKKCTNLNRIHDLISILSSKINSRFKFSKFLMNLPFVEIKSRKQLKKLMEAIMKTPFFKSHVKYFSLNFLERIHVKGSVDYYQGVFDPIIASNERLSFNMSAFLQSLPNVLKQQVTDEIIEFLTKNYSPIRYLQPEHFSQVQYALNLIVQQRSVSADLRVMFLLNPRFQKCISATSFELIYESLVVHDFDLLEQQKSIVKMRQQFVSQYMSYVSDLIDIQKSLEEKEKEVQEILMRKHDDIKEKLDIGFKKTSKKSTAEMMKMIVIQNLNQSQQKENFEKNEIAKKNLNKMQNIKLQKKKQQKEETFKEKIQIKAPVPEKSKEEQEKDKEKEKEEQKRLKDIQKAINNRMKQRLEEQIKDGKILEEEEEELTLLLKEKKEEEIKEGKDKKRGKITSNEEQSDKIELASQQASKFGDIQLLRRKENNEQQNQEEEELNSQKINIKTNNNRKSSISSRDSNIIKKLKFQLNDINSPAQTPQKSFKAHQIGAKNSVAKGNTLDDANKIEEEREKLVQEQAEILMESYKQMNKSNFILVGINKLKNSDKGQINKKQELLVQVTEIESMITLMNEHLLYLEYKRREMKRKATSTYGLFEFFDSLNLAYNKYFNQQGLNKYISSYIGPWLNMNPFFKNINEKNFINLKVFTEKSYPALKNDEKNNQQDKKEDDERKNNAENAQLNANTLLQKKQNDKQGFQDQIQDMLKADHSLDDSILRNLTLIIHEKMNKLRKINLSGLNVGDEFAAEFSLVLANSEKLTSLKRLQLFHNRRISSFGLKYLFSNIVKRIPQGFKIDISPSLYDFQCLHKSIYLLERQLVQSLYRISSFILSNSKKKFNAKTAILNQLAPKKNEDKDKQQKVDLNKSDVNNIHEDHQLLPQNQAIRQKTIKHTLVPQDDLVVAQQKIEQRIREAIKKNLNIALFKQEDKVLEIENSDEEEDEDENNLKKKSKLKTENKKNVNEEEQEEGEDEDNQDEEMLLQLKAIETKKDILEWQLLSFDGELNKKLIDIYQERNGIDGKKLINQIVSLRIKYEKSLLQIKAQKIEDEDEDDGTVIIQNLVNEGFYDTINYFIKKENRSVIITIGIVFFPFTIFHFFQVITHTAQEWINTFQFDELIHCSYFEPTYSVELTKMVPATIGSQDFYFDEDVARLNQILVGQPQDPNKKRQNLNFLKLFLKDPIKNKKFYDQIGKTPRYRSSNILNHSLLIFLLTFFIFQIGMCIIWPYFLVTILNETTCDNINWVYDIPFYFCSIFLVVIEILMLQNVERVLAAKQIFSLKSALVVVLAYSSFMARYDQYTDMLFTFKTLRCFAFSDVRNIGIASLTVMSFNLFLSFLGLIWEFVLVIINSRNKNKKLHNTNFINQFTKIALISEFYGIGISLDRFSTSSANSLNFWPIPKELRSVKIPQIFLSKFQRVFLENIPMIIILFIFNTNYNNHYWYEWDNLKVLLSTIFSLYNSLSQAWIARPSIFRTYQMQEFLEFREQYQDIYRLKITLKNVSSKVMEQNEIEKKIEEFTRIYQLSDKHKSSSHPQSGVASHKARTRNEPSARSGSHQQSDNGSKSSHSLGSEKRNSQQFIEEEKDGGSQSSGGKDHDESGEIEDDKNDSIISNRGSSQKSKKIDIEEDDYKRQLYDYILGSSKQDNVPILETKKPALVMKRSRTKNLQ